VVHDLNIVSCSEQVLAPRLLSVENTCVHHCCFHLATESCLWLTLHQTQSFLDFDLSQIANLYFPWHRSAPAAAIYQPAVEGQYTRCSSSPERWCLGCWSRNQVR